MKKHRVISILLILFIPLSVCGCKSERQVSNTFFAMDTAMSFTLYGEKCQEALDACEREIYRLDEILSPTDPKGEVCRINASSGSFCKVSRETAYIISFAKEMAEKTGYTFDISVFPAVKAWGFFSKEFRVPSEYEISELLLHIDSKSITVKEDSVKLEKGQEIELGAIAKGYLTDRIYEILVEYGIKKAVVSLGGNVLVLGERENGKSWRIGIEDPKKPGSTAGVLEIKDTFIITSGDYQRYFEVDGKRYHHIFDPSTARPSDSGLISATVIMRDGMSADSLSTALFVMGVQKAEKFWQLNKNFEMILIDSDYRVYATSGLKDVFSLNSETEYTLEFLQD